MSGERARWRIVGGPAPVGPYTELAEIARALEVEYAGAPELEVRINATRFSLSLEISSGVVVGLKLRAELEPVGGGAGPFIHLRREREEDREGKRLGINREVQLRDPTFDAAVYVDADASDDEVRRVLAKPATRRAALSLLDAGCTVVGMSREAVTATFSRGGPRAVFSRQHVTEALENVLALSTVGGPRDHGPSRRGRWLLGIACCGVLVSSAYLIGVLAAWDFDGRLPLLGAVAGLALGLASQPLVAWLAKGDPGSYPRYLLTWGLLAFNGLVLGAAVPVHLNVVLDPAAPQITRGTATSVGEYDSESGTHTIGVDWRDGAHEEFGVSPPVEQGDVIVRRTYPGRFGFRWSEHPKVEK